MGVAIAAARRCRRPPLPPVPPRLPCHKAQPNFQASRGPSRAARKASRAARKASHGRHRGVTILQKLVANGPLVWEPTWHAGLAAITLSPPRAPSPSDVRCVAPTRITAKLGLDRVPRGAPRRVSRQAEAHLNHDHAAVGAARRVLRRTRTWTMPRSEHPDVVHGRLEPGPLSGRRGPTLFTARRDRDRAARCS
jgi:hypothetical protein